LIYFATLVALLGAIIAYFIRKQSIISNDAKKLVQALFDARAKGHLQLPLVKSSDLQYIAYSIEKWNKELEERQIQLLNENKRLKEIFFNATVGLIAINDRLYIEAINDMACKIFNIKSEEAKGRYILEAIRDVHLESMARSVIANDSSLSDDIEIMTDNHQLILRVSISPLETNSGISGAVISLEDITELKQLEQVKADLVANMSHEIKTPLTSIKGFTETLLDGAMDDHETCKRFLTIINSEADRMSRLISDSLTLSRLENQEQNIGYEQVNIYNVISNVLSMLDTSAEAKNISITFNAQTPEMTIEGDEDRIHQLMLNLIDNAIKYTPANGKVTVTLRDEGDNVLISVKDTGIGIAKEHIPRLFERFYRVDKGRSRNMGGTGLGLAIVKHVVMSMNGTIDVDSKLGEGTEFIVHLPKRHSFAKL